MHLGSTPHPVGQWQMKVQILYSDSPTQNIKMSFLVVTIASDCVGKCTPHTTGTLILPNTSSLGILLVSLTTLGFVQEIRPEMSLKDSKNIVGFLGVD